MRHRRRSDRESAERYSKLAARLSHAEVARVAAQKALTAAQAAERPLSEIRSTYNTIAVVSQEPLPAEPALDRRRPAHLTRELSRLRTLRQFHLLDAPRGVLAPASVRPTSRAATGPHVPGLDFGVAVPIDSPYERRWGVDLPRLLDVPRSAAWRDITATVNLSVTDTAESATGAPQEIEDIK